MSIPGLNSSTAINSPASKSEPATNGGTVDKEAFLKLLVAQLQHQDPLSPMEGTEFISQLAEFSNVEQAIAQNSKMDLISMQLTGIASNEAIGLIGKEVTIRGDKITFDGSQPTGFNARLNKSANEVTVTIRDDRGTAVRTMELGPQKGGTLEVPWDGTDNSGMPALPGTYSVEISARDANGSPVQTSQDVKGTVVGVTFDKGYPEVILDSGAHAPISDLIGVEQPKAASTPGQSSLSSTLAQGASSLVGNAKSTTGNSETTTIESANSTLAATLGQGG